MWNASRLSLAASAFLFTGLAPGSSSAHPYRPRAIVRRVADLIAADYVHESIGAGLAKTLRAEAARGSFDQLSPAALSATITDELKRTDRHFRLIYTPPASNPQASITTQTAEPDTKLSERRINWGFRRVEVLPGNIGYLDISEFADFDPKDRPTSARRAADAAVSILGGADAIIVDMRNNSGGSPVMVDYLISAFVQRSEDIYTVIRDRGSKIEIPQRALFDDPPNTTVPLYVLTSARTGSAAEDFAYTLQVARRATLVGERTDGAANPGSIFEVDEGFTIFISSGEAVNPISGSNWEKVGVTPDILCSQDEALRLAELDALKRTLAVDRGNTPALWELETLLRPHETHPSSALPIYVGEFGSREIAIVNGQLIIRRGRWPVHALISLGGDLFTLADASNRRIRFNRDQSGNVMGLVEMQADGQQREFARSGVIG